MGVIIGTSASESVGAQVADRTRYTCVPSRKACCKIRGGVKNQPK